MDPAGIPALQEAIRHLHGLEATWIESVPVHETHEGKTVWDGEVQVFSVTGHAKATPAGEVRRAITQHAHLDPVDFSRNLYGQ